MVEIKCSPKLIARDINQVIVSTPIITFPGGEADFSIYRSPDGRGDDLKFKGIEADTIFSVFGIEDPKNKENIEESNPQNPLNIFSPEDTEITSIAQSTYNSPSYWKCVKKQYERQFCSTIYRDSDLIPLQALILFVRKRVEREFFLSLPERFFTLYRGDIVNKKLSPYSALISRSETTVEFLDRNDPNRGENFNKDFYSELVTL